MSKPSTSDLTPSSETPVPVDQLLLAENQVLNCECGHYPWDHWERQALARGLSKDLAGLGRLLIREAFNHDWPEELRAVCGWRDDGEALLDLALRAPRQARRQWGILMRTDGLRGDSPSPRSFEWTWGYLRPDALRLQLSIRP